jgi:hypothetical protein
LRTMIAGPATPAPPPPPAPVGSRPSGGGSPRDACDAFPTLC